MKLQNFGEDKIPKSGEMNAVPAKNLVIKIMVQLGRDHW